MKRLVVTSPVLFLFAAVVAAEWGRRETGDGRAERERHLLRAHPFVVEAEGPACRKRSAPGDIFAAGKVLSFARDADRSKGRQ